MAATAQVIDADRYIRGVVYTHGGRDWPRLDCWGLVRLVY